MTSTQATIRQPSRKEKSKTPKTSQSGSSSRGEGKFLAGTVLNNRYRITGLLGRGGMGEVYKAEDLKLNQTVALKFLPEDFADDSTARERFFGEVRTARQVSHQNVCRVFDIGEVAGTHFLSMEFIDGDDLSSLLRRIGRLPSDKALEIARQLCAGLHAVHQAGILHRDFKPANVMIDGRGKARLTDFGVARLESDLKEGALAGTPAYMSPEQITGKELTTKSDIYSLGLVLYEIFTGKRAFEGNLNELLRQHKSSAPTTPSELVKHIDPLVDQVIMRCLEKDPQQRPASALQVALALPGGDPLQAALAMGQTPSPEMVAAAGEKTGLRPVVALACLLGIVASLIGLAFLTRQVSFIEKIPFDNSAEMLAGKARETVAQLGYPERPVDSAYGLNYDVAPDSWQRIERDSGVGVHLWYRESPDHLQLSKAPPMRKTWSLNYADPPSSLPGTRSVKLNTLGQLREFHAWLPQVDEAESSGVSAPDWSRLFVLASIDPSRFTPTEARWNPDSVSDARAAWTGTIAEMPDIPLRVEAAGYRGKVVFFKLIFPWMEPKQLRAGRTSPLFTILVPLGLFIGAALLAWRNHRQGKGDRQGAIRLAVFFFVSEMLFWLLTANHVPTTEELSLFGLGVRASLFWGAMVWALYMALEPYVRRRWPTRLITWSRVLAGKITDPLVGRDLLIGILIGLCFSLLQRVPALITSTPVADVELDILLGVRFILGVLLHYTLGAVIIALTLTFLLTLLRALVRRDWVAAAVAILIFALPALLIAALPLAVVSLTIGSLAVLAFIRFGLLTVAASVLINIWLGGLPVTANLRAWYAGTSVFVMLLVLALTGYAFYISLGGQQVFKGKLLQDLDRN